MAQRVITNTTAYPWRTAVSIYVRWSNGAVTRGSGTIVGGNDILTASHVVYNPARGRPVHISVIPAQNGQNTPFGIIKGRRFNYYIINYSPGGLLTRSQSSKDLAVIGLEDIITAKTGYLRMQANVTSTGIRNLISYPSHRAVSFTNLRQIHHYGDVSFDSANQVYNIGNLGVSSGSSGGGIYRYDGTNRFVVGTVSTGSWGSFISSDRLTQIASWMRNNNNVVDRNKTDFFNIGNATRYGRRNTVNRVSNDIDRYSFHLNGTTTVSFTLLSQRNKDADLFLYDLYGRRIASSTRGANRTDVIRRTLGTGIYYVEVNAFSAGPIVYRLAHGRGAAASVTAAATAAPASGNVATAAAPANLGNTRTNTGNNATAAVFASNARGVTSFAMAATNTRRRGLNALAATA